MIPIKTRSPLGMRGKVAGERKDCHRVVQFWTVELDLHYEGPILGITEWNNEWNITENIC